MIYTITLNPALDYYMDYSNEKTISKHMRTNKTHFFAAGKGVNASILLKNLNIKNKALVLGEKKMTSIFKNKLKKQQINYKIFNTYNDVRINIKMQVNDTYEFITTSYNKNPKIINQLLRYLNKKVKNNDFVLVMGSIIKNIPKDSLSKIFELINKKNCKLVFDLSGNEWQKYLKYKPFLIKPNVSELENIFNVKISSKKNIEKYAKKLINLGAENVIISHDKNGSYLFNKDNSYIASPLKIKLINGSGAGDSMVGGFVAKYNQTNSIKEAFKFSNASGAASASVVAIAGKENIINLYKKVKIKDFTKEKKC